MQNSIPDLTSHGGEQVIVMQRVADLKSQGHRVRTIFQTEKGPRYSDDLSNWYPMPRNKRWRPLFHLIVEKPVRLLQTIIPGVPYLNLFDSLRFADAVRPLLADVDIILERFSPLGHGGLFLAQWLKIPRVLELHGHPFDEVVHFTQPYAGLQGWAMRCSIRGNTDQATMVLPSGYGWERRWIETGLLRREHSRIVWPGVDLTLFRRCDEHLGRYDAGANRGPRVAFAGGFFGWQGLEGLIRAFAAVRPSVPEAMLLLIGDGPLESELRNLVSGLDCEESVRFLGTMPQQRVVEILCGCDIGVQLYEKRAEYVGMKLFEYMAAGNAVVVTAPARRHDLIEDGKNGLVILPGDQDGLVQALYTLLTNEQLCQRLGRAARQTVEKGHTWDDRAVEVETALYDALGRTGH